MPRKPEDNFVEIICLYCIQSNAAPCRYFCHNTDHKGFLQANFSIDYALVAYIYRNYQKLASDTELSDLSSVVFLDNGEGGSPTFDNIEIKYEEDKSYEDKEVMKEELKLKRPEEIFLFDVPRNLKKCLCFGCKRVFNKRNVPFKMRCGHTICEVCAYNYTEKRPKEGRILFKCACRVLHICIKTIKIPKRYSVKWIARELLTIDKKLLDTIYDKISINAKKAAWEFSLKKHPISAELEERLCCEKCKTNFINTIPYLIPCGHNVCLKCAFEGLANEGTFQCTIDNQTIKSAQKITTPAELGGRMQANEMLRKYLKDNYADPTEEYESDVVDDSSRECPVCSIGYDNGRHKKCIQCKSKHSICWDCLVYLFSIAIKRKKNEIISVSCVTCRFTVEMRSVSGKGAKYYAEKFNSIASKYQI